MSRMPVFFISHGGEPWPYMDELRSLYQQTENALRRVARRLPTRPTSILVVTAHWVASVFSVATNAYPAMEYDYGGFPEHTYAVQYTAPGDPLLAGRVQRNLAHAGISAKSDSNKGFDHGVFVPLGMMFPEAAIPVVVVSVKGGYDPGEHLALGQALVTLRAEGALIVGSGQTYHNLRAIGKINAAHDAEYFTQYLDETLVEGDTNLRAQRLFHWERGSARLSSSRGAPDAASGGRWGCGS